MPIFTQKNPTSRQKYFCKKSRRSRYSSHWNMGKCNSLLWKNNQTYINIHNSTIINILYLCATLHANDGLPPFPEHENEMTGGHPLYVAMLGSIYFWYQRTQRMLLQFRIKLTSQCVPGTKNAEIYREQTAATLWDTLMQSIPSSSSQAKVSTNTCSIFAGSHICTMPWWFHALSVYLPNKTNLWFGLPWI